MDGVPFIRYIAPADHQRFMDFVAESARGNAAARSLHLDMKDKKRLVGLAGGIGGVANKKKVVRLLLFFLSRGKAREFLNLSANPSQSTDVFLCFAIGFHIEVHVLC